MTTDTTGTVAQPAAEAAPTQGPVSAFDRMLAFLDQEDKPAQAEATAEGQSETADPNAESAQPEEEKAEEAESAEEGAESEEEAEQAEPPKDTLYTVRVDGKEEQVPLSELLAGYSRTSDYTRKTQEVANQRKQLEQSRAELVQERQEYQSLLPKLREMISQGEQEPNWEALRQQDPVQALIAQQRWNERQEKIRKLEAEEARVAELESKRIESERSAFIASEREKLFAMPDLSHWRDEAKRKADGQMIAETLLAAGYTPEELQIYDSRAMLIAYKAALYDKGKVKGKQAEEAIRGKVDKSPTVKPGSPAGKPKGESRKAFDRLAKTGRRADAEAWFLHNL